MQLYITVAFLYITHLQLNYNNLWHLLKLPALSYNYHSSCRRQSQIGVCGFHTSPGHKYQEVGDVELDDKTLILQGLGQLHLTDVNQKPLPVNKDHSVVTKKEDIILSPVVLRGRAASQFPDQLMDLQMQLCKAHIQLDKMRKGHGLFYMLDEDKREKVRLQQMLQDREAKSQLNEWQPADIDEYEDEPTTPTNDLSSEISSESSDHTISNSYYMLCTLVWILESMKLESPTHMPSLHSFWHINRPAITEAKCRAIYNRTSALIRQYDDITCTTNQPSEVNASHCKELGHKRSLAKEKEYNLRMEEMKLRRQRKLTSEQLEGLKILIEQELNPLSKRSKNTIMQLAKEKAKELHSVRLPKLHPLPITNFDPTKAANNFTTMNENRSMVVHEQLTAIDRDRREALEQRFSSLRVTGRMWKDLKNMRSGIEIESTDMARNKLMMNYNWLPALKSTLNNEVFDNQYCQALLKHLSNLQDYMRIVGPQKMSLQKLISVLSILRPWELVSPIIATTIEFVIKNVIYIVPEDYKAWLDHQTLQYYKQKNKQC
jgi:hypothetical protein